MLCKKSATSEIHRKSILSGLNHPNDRNRRFRIQGWPDGISAASNSSDAFVLNIDLAQTILECAGVTAPSQMQGRSLKPILENPLADWPERRLVVESQRVRDPIKYRNFAVMTDRWRLTGTQDEQFELFDIARDRGPGLSRAGGGAV